MPHPMCETIQQLFAWSTRCLRREQLPDIEDDGRPSPLFSWLFKQHLRKGSLPMHLKQKTTFPTPGGPFKCEGQIVWTVHICSLTGSYMPEESPARSDEGHASCEFENGSSFTNLPWRVFESATLERIAAQPAPCCLRGSRLVSVLRCHPQPWMIEGICCRNAPRNVDSEHTRHKVGRMRAAALKKGLVVLPAGHAILRVLRRSTDERLDQKDIHKPSPLHQQKTLIVHLTWRPVRKK